MLCRSERPLIYVVVTTQDNKTVRFLSEIAETIWCIDRTLFDDTDKSKTLYPIFAEVGEGAYPVRIQ